MVARTRSTEATRVKSTVTRESTGNVSTHAKRSYLITLLTTGSTCAEKFA